MKIQKQIIFYAKFGCWAFLKVTNRYYTETHHIHPFKKKTMFCFFSVIIQLFLLKKNQVFLKTLYSNDSTGSTESTWALCSYPPVGDLS